MVGRALEPGLTFAVAADGKEGLAQILKSLQPSSTSYDAVLMDVEMPGRWMSRRLLISVMDGITAVQLLREHEQNAKSSRPQLVVALTGNARQGQIDRAFEAGMNDGQSSQSDTADESGHQAIQICSAGTEARGCDPSRAGQLQQGLAVTTKMLLKWAASTMRLPIRSAARQNQRVQKRLPVIDSRDGCQADLASKGLAARVICPNVCRQKSATQSTLNGDASCQCFILRA